MNALFLPYCESVLNDIIYEIQVNMYIYFHVIYTMYIIHMYIHAKCLLFLPYRAYIFCLESYNIIICIVYIRMARLSIETTMDWQYFNGSSLV